MAVKATLTTQLLANGVVIAESESQSLWYEILQAIQSGSPLLAQAEVRKEKQHVHVPPPSNAPNDRVSAFASELGVDRVQVEGGCSPSVDAPFIRLDRHHWEALRRNTGDRGPGTVAPVALAATLLVLWWKHAGRADAPTITEIPPVLATIDLPVQNVRRSVQNCRWLQLRERAIVLNPARTSAALALARAYCNQTPVEEGTLTQ